MKKSKADLFLEKVPPALVWIFITLPIWGGLFFPKPTAYLVIVVNVYFLYKSLSFTAFFIYAYNKLLASEKLSWEAKLRELDNIKNSLNNLTTKINQIKQTQFDSQKFNKIATLHKHKKSKLPLFMQKIVFNLSKRKSIRFLQEEFDSLKEIQQNGLNTDWKDIHHLVIIPHWKEPISVLRDTLTNLKNVNYPTSKINIVLGAEARDKDGIKKSKQLKREFADHFENIWINSHVMKTGEIVGKSSNMASAGQYAKKKIDKLKWDYKNVVVTSCDADSLLPKDYFANVSYLYATIPDYNYKYFNAAILFYANIWRLPAYARVKNSIGSLYNIAKLARPDKFVPFSTYSVSFWLVDRIGYWSPWVTPEDYHLYFKGVFNSPDKVSAIPVFQRIMADAAEGSGHIDTIKNTYFQSRRWAWGVSDDGWIIKQVIKLAIKGKLTLQALYKASHVILDHVGGTSMTLLVMLGANLPPMINKAYSGTVMAVNLPQVSSFMMKITLVFLIIIIIFDTFVVKPVHPNGKRSILKKIFSIFEWIFLPITGYLLVVLPDIEANTRLLFGKYLEYYLTKKK